MWLGIETSSLVSSVALMDEHNLIGELTIQAGLTHSEQLIPHIDMLLRASLTNSIVWCDDNGQLSS